MTKTLSLRNIEHGIQHAITILGDHGIQSALMDKLNLSRSASLIRKCANPNEERQHLQLRYAVALDAACVELGERAPILTAYTHLLEDSSTPQAAKKIATQRALVREVVALQAALGDLARAVEQLQEEDTMPLRQISRTDRQHLSEALDGVLREAYRIERMINS